MVRNGKETKVIACKQSEMKHWFSIQGQITLDVMTSKLLTDAPTDVCTADDIPSHVLVWPSIRRA